MVQEALCDPDLDAQLENLRNKLTAVTTFQHVACNSACFSFFLSPFVFPYWWIYDVQVGKESAVLNRELQAFKRQSTSSNHCVGVVNEALQLYEQNSMHDLFQGN